MIAILISEAYLCGARPYYDLKGTVIVYWSGSGIVYLDPTKLDGIVRITTGKGTISKNYTPGCLGVFLQPAWDITSVFSVGLNTVTLEVYDYCEDVGNGDAAYVSGTGINIVGGYVYHTIDYLESTTTYPLKNVKVDIRYCWEDPVLNIMSYEDQKTYYTISNGQYATIISNPYGIFDYRYWLFEANKLISGEGWNKVYITASTCSTSNTITSDYKLQLDNIYLNHTLTETLAVKNEHDNSPVVGATVGMYQIHFNYPDQITDVNGEAVFTVYPETISHNIQKSEYRTYTPIYTNLISVDTQTCAITQTPLLTPLASDKALIEFTGKDSIGYYPNNTFQMNYNVGYSSGVIFRIGAYINLIKPNGTTIRIPNIGGLDLPNYFPYSPPTINYTPTTGGSRGIWMAKMLDINGIEWDNDKVFFGTKGNLGYDISAYCANKTITINWSGVDPINMQGSQPFTQMKINIYDGSNVLQDTTYLSSASGILDPLDIAGKSITNPWKATLTDQWGVIIDTKYINITSCNQRIFGKVLASAGNPIADADVILDLTGEGYGTFPTTTSSTGSYMISDIPTFLSQPISAAKTGYPTASVNVTVEAGQFLEQNFTLGGLLTGTVIDVEDNPIHRAAVWISGKCYGTTNDQGIYNISPVETGTYNLNVIKNNFIINTKSINLPDLINTVTTNFTLTRKTQETYSGNFPTTTLVCETSGIQCDDLTTSTITTSGQQIALADYTNSKMGSGARSVQTGQGLYEIENHPYMNDYSTRVITVGSTLTINEGFVIKVEDINLYVTRMAILVLLHDSVSIETQIIFPNTTVVFEGEVDGESYCIRLGIGEIYFGKEVAAVFIESVYQGTALTGPGYVTDIAQRFETNFNFNHFKVALINDAYIYENGEFVQTHNAPCRVNVMLYDETGYTVTGTSIAFGTPIFKDTVVLLPGTAQYVDFYCITQPPGYYCIQMKMPDDGDTLFKIGGMTPNLYYDSVGNLMKAYEGGIETAPSISLMMVIYEAPMQIERYLIRGGAIDVTGQYITDAKDTNLVEIV